MIYYGSYTRKNKNSLRGDTRELEKRMLNNQSCKEAARRKTVLPVRYKSALLKMPLTGARRSSAASTCSTRPTFKNRFTDRLRLVRVALQRLSLDDVDAREISDRAIAQHDDQQRHGWDQAQKADEVVGVDAERDTEHLGGDVEVVLDVLFQQRADGRVQAQRVGVEEDEGDALNQGP